MLRFGLTLLLFVCSCVQASVIVPTDPHPQVQFDFGIATYAFREQSLEKVIECAQKLQIKKLALKSMHLPLDSSADHIKSVCQTIRDKGLEPYAGAVIYMNSKAEVDQAFRYAQQAGMIMIVGVPKPELLDYVEDKVKATGVKLAIHIHGNRKMLYPDAASVYPLIKDRDPGMGICLDVGHQIRLNQDPAAAIRQYGERILDVQLWDCTSASGQGRAVLAGYGVLDLAGIFQALIDVGYTGTVSVEFWMDAKMPQFGTAQTLGYCQGILAMLPRQKVTPNVLTDAEKAAGWQLLFDGKTTKGWRSINKNHFPAHGWGIQDGALCILANDGAESQNGGDIITEEMFRDFELCWEWKMVTSGGNSGLKYAVVEGLADNSKHGIGLEYQILDDANHGWMINGKMKSGDYHTVGSLYELYPAQNKKLKPLGQYNQSRIVKKGEHIEHWLNGIKVLSYIRGSEDYRKRVKASKFKGIPGFGEVEEGHILLQDHGSPVCFRNIKIRELGQ